MGTPCSHRGWLANRYGQLLCGLLLCAGHGFALASTTLRLPPHVCDAQAPAPMMADGFENAWSNPSGGNTQTAVGPIERAVTYNSVTRLYYLYVPLAYTPSRAWPLVVALHGAAGAGLANLAAQSVRDRWQTVADASGVIIMAPVASGATSGSWVPAHDYGMIAFELGDLESRYNIERARRQLWGFSAGGHVAHDIALAGPSGLNSSVFAGYSVSAGALEMYACSPSRPEAPSCQSLLANAPRKLPIDIHIGTLDPLYSQFTSQDPVRFLAAGWQLNLDIRYIEFGAGHTFTSQHAAEIWAFLCPYAVIP